MLKLQIGPNDPVLVVMPVTMAHTVISGSTHVSCDDCGTDCWRAPAGGPTWGVGANGYRLNYAAPEPKFILCVPCADVYYQFGPTTQ